MDFEWDEDKAARNLAKHGIPFDYAAQVFWDAHRLEEEDPQEHAGEMRYTTIGHVEGHVLLVVYAYRDTRIRLISARRATRHERKRYHEV